MSKQYITKMKTMSELGHENQKFDEPKTTHREPLSLLGAKCKCIMFGVQNARA